MPFNFENAYAKLSPKFFSRATPRKASAPAVVAWNTELANFLNLSVTDRHEIAEIFTGNQIPTGAEPIAQVYAGHQFGQFVPRLGDGRAILLGEVRAQDGQLYDVQLKGAGTTAYSRNGDGLAALGPVLREYLVSEFMHRAGVPSTRALAFCTTGDTVAREERLPGAVLTRVASSHVRVGTFQYFAAQEDAEALGELLKFCVDRHYPHLNLDENLPLNFLKEVLKGQAALVAKWHSLGFIHGVMNTDNTSVAAITIDYGPCAFMDTYKVDQVYSYIDRNGRYAYGNQSRMAHWNLIRLAECLAPLCAGSPESVVERINEVLGTFPELFTQAWCQEMGKKLGLSEPTSADKTLIESWLNYLQKAQLDFTLSHRNLGELLHPDEAKFFPQIPERSEFLNLWQGRIAAHAGFASELAQINPLFIPRNHLVERAIQGANGGDFSSFYALEKLLQNPFTPQPGQDVMAYPPRPEEVVAHTFCGT